MSAVGFTGSYFLVEIGYRLDEYVPDLVEPLTYTTRDGQRIVMDEAFETDGATSPRLLWWIPGFSPWDWRKAAMLHDWLYELRKMGRSTIGFFGANRHMRDGIRSLRWPWIVAWLAWLAVTCFGWVYWYRGLKR